MINYETDGVISQAGQDMTDRVRVIDNSAEAPYRNRVMGDNEYIEVTNSGQSSYYMQALADCLDAALNNPETFDAMTDESVFRFHEEHNAPSAIMIPALADNSCYVRMQDAYSDWGKGQAGDQKPIKLTMSQGSTIVSKPAGDAILLQLSLERYDSEVDGALSANTLKQEVQAIAEQIDNAVIVKTIDMLMNATHRGQFLKNTDVPLGMAPSHADRVEAIENAIDLALFGGRSFGMGIEDFVIGLDDVCYKAMQRVARRAGVTGDKSERGCAVSAFLGTSVYAFPKSDDVPSVIVIPRRHCALSFRTRDGGTKAFDFIVSRNASKQAATMEIIAVIDVLAQGFVTMRKQDGQTVDIALPLIQAFTFNPTKP